MMGRVSRESQDTPTGGGGVSWVHTRDDPGMVRVSRESQDIQRGGSELCPSRDDPGMVEVSQEVHVQMCKWSICHPKLILRSSWGCPSNLGHP